jgi:uncharacterized membrane protein
LSIASLLVLAWAAYLTRAFSTLPSRVASHYGLSGRADGFQDKVSFLETGLLVPLVMLVFVVVLPILLRKMPAQAINMPRRDFWLAPERRESTFATLTMYLDWFGVATLALMAAVLVLIVRANLQDTELRFVHVGTLLSLYLVFSITWVRALYKTFG